MSAPYASDLVDLKLELLRETEKAFGVDNGDNVGKITWLPKSMVEREGDTFTMPKSLAIEKQLDWAIE
jgi:hypothetical protein